MKEKIEDLLGNNATELGRLILGMRDAYKRGENAMEYARKSTGISNNSPIATLIAYDLQAGSYIAHAKDNSEYIVQWCTQLANILNPYINNSSSVLEVGCGEATTLAGVLKRLNSTPAHALGFDISWSRCAHGLTWLEENSVAANLFVANIFEIPLENESIDVVYTSHSLEPNGGREEDAIKELMRVARRAVVLVEPVYELASDEAKKRMSEHGYVRGLKETAESLGARVKDYRLLDYCGNHLNPSGLVIIEKSTAKISEGRDINWRCPLTHLPLVDHSTGFYSRESGLIYPVLAGIPLLSSSNALLASSFEAITASSKTD